MFTVTNPPTRKIGSVADIDPVNEYYGSLTPTTNNNHVPQHQPPPPPANSLVSERRFATRIFIYFLLFLFYFWFIFLFSFCFFVSFTYLARLPSNVRLRGSGFRRSELLRRRSYRQLYGDRRGLDDGSRTTHWTSRHASRKLRRARSDLTHIVNKQNSSHHLRVGKSHFLWAKR